MCDEVCECCEKDICKCEKINPDLNKMIEESKKHFNKQLYWKGWEIVSNQNREQETFIRILWQNLDTKELKKYTFSLLTPKWHENFALDPNKYYIDDFIINNYGIYVSIGVK